MKILVIKQKILIAICAIYISIVLSACSYAVPEEKRADIISSIAVIVNDNFTNQDKETPLQISITEIDELTDDDSDLKKSIEKYNTIKDYRVYLFDNGMILVVTENLGLGVRGYVVSDEELEGTITVHGVGFDADMISITNRIENSNLYCFSAGQ